jgi:hypothetical protein
MPKHVTPISTTCQWWFGYPCDQSLQYLEWLIAYNGALQIVLD